MNGMISGKALNLIILVLISIGSADLYGQTRSQGPWWPNKLWGAEDQSGASNWITPEKVLKSVSD